MRNDVERLNMQICSVSWLVSEDGPAFESVLRLNVSVCNPVVLVLVDVTKQEDAEVLAGLCSGESCSSEHGPLTEVHVTVLEMGENAWVDSEQT